MQGFLDLLYMVRAPPRSIKLILNSCEKAFTEAIDLADEVYGR